MAKYVAVWIDHKEARIFQIHSNKIEETTVTAPHLNTHHKHPKGRHDLKDHPDDAKRYFTEIEAVLRDADSILVVGPSTAKLEFVRHLHRHALHLEPKVVGIETVDHPTDRQLIAYAKTYFRLGERDAEATV